MNQCPPDSETASPQPFLGRGTVLAADIVALSPALEGKLPLELVAMMNRHVEYVLTVIHAHRGIAGYQIGTAVIAYWLESAGDAGHAQAAFACARQLLTGLPTLLKQQGADYDMRIALGSGELAGQLFGPIGQFQIVGHARSRVDRIDRSFLQAGSIVRLCQYTAEALGAHSELQSCGSLEREGQAPMEVFEWWPTTAARRRFWSNLTG
jgi:class 3 adenylate cyclase